MSVERYRVLLAHGQNLRVYVHGLDETNRCRYADDTPGHQVAILYRVNHFGRKYLDEDGRAAVEVAEGDVIIRPDVREP